VLAEAGLRAGQLALAQESPNPVRVLALPPQRRAAPTEAVVYLLVSTLARRGAVRVSVKVVGPVITVDVTATELSDSLVDVEDRIGALGGTLTLDRSASCPSVHAELPCG
jgi:hypothetical protein